LAANVQLQDVCLALDIVQQKSTRVKVERTISFSSQKFDEKNDCAATRTPQAACKPQTVCTSCAAGRVRAASRARAASRMHAARKIRYLQADTGLNVLGTSKRKA